MRLDLYKNTKPVSPEQVTILHRRYKAGCQRSFHKLIESNAGLAYKITIYYYEKSKTNRSVESDDLLQAAFIGLCEGIRKFDPDRGYKISTYVAWWIRKYVTKEIHAAHYRVKPKVVDANEYLSGHMSPEGMDWYMSTFINASDIDRHADTRVDVNTDVASTVMYDVIIEDAKRLLTKKQYRAFKMRADGYKDKEIRDTIGKNWQETLTTGVQIMADEWGGIDD